MPPIFLSTVAVSSRSVRMTFCSLSAVRSGLSWDPTLEAVWLYVDFAVDFKAVGFLTGARLCFSHLLLGLDGYQLCLGNSLLERPTEMIAVSIAGIVAAGSFAPVASVANASRMHFSMARNVGRFSHGRIS